MGRDSALNSYYLFDVYCNCLCGLDPSVAVLPANMPTTQLLPSSASDSSSHDGPPSPDMPSQSSSPSFSPSPDPRHDREEDNPLSSEDPLPDDLFSYDDLSFDLSLADPPDNYGYVHTPASPNPSQRPPLIDFLSSFTSTPMIIDNSNSTNNYISNSSSVSSQYSPLTASPAPSQYQPSFSLPDSLLLSPSASMDLQLSLTASHSDRVAAQTSKPNDLADASPTEMDTPSNNNNISINDGSLNTTTVPVNDFSFSRPRAADYFFSLSAASSVALVINPPEEVALNVPEKDKSKTHRAHRSASQSNLIRDRKKRLKQTANSEGFDI